MAKYVGRYVWEIQETSKYMNFCEFELSNVETHAKNQPEMLEEFDKIIDDLREEGWLDANGEKWGIE